MPAKARGDMQFSQYQREILCEMTGAAYWEIRHLAEEGKLEQACDLAAVFHDLLDDVWTDDFSLPEFREEFLKRYQLKHCDPAAQYYIVLMDRIIAIGKGHPPET
ncbi:MAG: hypothetical protein ABSH48_13740 [Verrucomicrobiota bacterium]